MSFDVLAPHYTWMEVVLAGPRLQRCRLTWLDALAGRQHILIAGVGHGHFLRRCAERFPAAAITCVDASLPMLRQAQRRLSRAGLSQRDVTFVHAALPGWTPVGTFDAIVTHFFLDCFPPSELDDVIHRLAAAATPDARWLIGDFALPASGLRRLRARAIHAVMYAFFRRVTKLSARTLTAPDAFLHRAGFRLVGRRLSEWDLLQADLWERRPAQAFPAA